MAGQNWRKNKKGFMVNSDGKTRQQVLAEKRRRLDKNRAIDKIYGNSSLSTSEIRKIQKKHPDLVETLKSRKGRDKFDPSTAESGDVIVFKRNGNNKAKELHKLHPESVYHQITSIKNGKIRGIPLDKEGNPLSTKSQALKANYLEGKHFDKGNAWIKVNFPQDEWGKNKKETLSDREVDYIAKSSNLSSQQVREFYAQGKLGNEKTIARFKRDANLSDKLKNIKPTRKFSESEQSLIDKTIKEVKEGKTSKKQIEQARDKQISEFLRVTGDRSIKHKSDKKRRYQAYREIQGLNYVLNQV